jgi:hypothetical protein
VVAARGRKKRAVCLFLCLFLDSLLRPKSELYSNTRDARLISSRSPGDQTITKVDCLRPTSRLGALLCPYHLSVLSPFVVLQLFFTVPNAKCTDLPLIFYDMARSQVGFCPQSTSVTSLGFVMASRQCALVYSQIYNSSDVHRGNLILAMAS